MGGWGTAVESPEGAGTARAAGEARLAHQAATGDDAAFAALYDRYELRLFNVCLRALGAPDQAAVATQRAFLDAVERWPNSSPGELEPGIDLLVAAHAALDGGPDRDRWTRNGEPGGDVTKPADEASDPELARFVDPERAELLASLQDDVRRANERLSQAQREVLALRDLDGLSYEQIATVTGSDDESVIESIGWARISLRDALRDSSLAQEATGAPACQRALSLLAMRLDGQLDDPDEREWLDDHLAVCGTCQASLDAMQEARIAYRAWLPLLPPAWLRIDTLTEAAERGPADRAGLDDQPWSPPRGNGAPPAARTIGAAVATPFADAAAVQASSPLAAAVAARARRRRALMVIVIPVVLLAGAAAAVLAVGGGSGTEKRAARTPAPVPAATPATATPTPRPATRKRKPKRSRPIATSTPNLPPRTTPTPPTTPRVAPRRTPRATPVSRAPRRTPRPQPQVIGGGRENGTPRQPVPSGPTPTPTSSTPTPPTPTVGGSTGSTP